MKKGQRKEKSNIGERLKLLRGDALQETIANKVGVSNAVYSNFEIGKSEPSLLITSRLANYFGVTLDYLVNGKTEPVEKIIEEKTGLSSEAIRVLKRINKTCEDKEIPNPVSQLIEKAEFQEAINELLCTIIILLNDSQGTTEDNLAKFVHRLNILHVLNGGDLDKYQGVFLEIARLHAEDAKNCMNKAIDKVRMGVWNNGTR